MGELLPIPVTQQDGTVLLFHPPGIANPAADIDIMIPTECADVDLSVLSPGLSCTAAVTALGCHVDLGTIVPGQTGHLASICPV